MDSSQRTGLCQFFSVQRGDDYFRAIMWINSKSGSKIKDLAIDAGGVASARTTEPLFSGGTRVAPAPCWPRAGGVFFESSSRSSQLLEHDLSRKTAPTFRDHALNGARLQRLQNLPKRLPEVFRHFDSRHRAIGLGSRKVQFGRQPMPGSGHAGAQTADGLNLFDRTASERR